MTSYSTLTERNNVRILCVGALTIDTIFQLEQLPRRPGKFIPENLQNVVAGMAASAALAVARLGGNASLWSAVGSDAAGAIAIATMSEQGVDCSPVVTRDHLPTAVASIFVDPQGERIIVPYYAPDLFENLHLPPVLDGNLCSAVLADVRGKAASATALKTAKERGLIGLLDADVTDAETLLNLAPLATHIVASRDGAEILTSMADPALCALGLQARYGVPVVVTDGGNGCFSVDAEGNEFFCPAFPVAVVDTTAAGDIFHGAYLLCLANGICSQDALRFASAAAALKCTRKGGPSGAPTLDEVMTFLAEQASTDT